MKQGAKARPLLLLAGLLLATGLAYSASLDGGLLFDDALQIEQNASVRDLAHYSVRVLWDRLGTGTRVLPDLTFALDYARSGLAPRAYHVTSLALHLLAVVLAFLLGRRLLAGLGWPDPAGPALAAAGLWALHPLNSQAVNYVVQRSEVMASLFYLLALWLVMVAVERGRTWAGAAAYLGALAAALAGLDSKQIVVTVPAVVLLVLVTTGAPAGPPARRWLVRLGLAAPFALLALWVATRTISSLAGSPHAGFDVPGLSPASYLLSQTRVLVQYLGLLAWPAGLNLDHGLTPSHSLLEPAVLASTALLLVLSAGALALARWGSRPGRDQRVVAATRLAPFGLAWFFVVLSPTSSVVPLVDLMFEHRVYLASWGIILGVVVLVSAALSRLVQPPERAATGGLVLALVTCAALGFALHQRNRVWANPASLWADVVAKAPGNWRGYQNLAQVLASRGQYRPAVELRVRALAVASQPQDRAEVLRNLGANLIELGQVDRAAATLLEAERLIPRDAGVQNNLAICAEELRRLDEAERRARRAIELDPEQPNAHGTLGRILARRGDLGGALDAFRQAVALSPDDLIPLHNLARAEELVGRQAEACATWRRYGGVRGGVGRPDAEAARARLRCP